MISTHMIDITIKNNLGESRVSFSFWVTVIIKGSQGRKLNKQRPLRNITDWLDPMAFSCSYTSQHHPPKMAPPTWGWASRVVPPTWGWASRVAPPTWG